MVITHLTSMQREAGMSHFEFGVMAALSRQRGRRLQLKDLAVIAGGSLSRLVASTVEAIEMVTQIALKTMTSLKPSESAWMP
jgi:hypothetical protein